MKLVLRDFYVLFGMTIGAFGAVLMAFAFGLLATIAWFAGISTVALVYTVYSALAEHRID